MASRQDRLHSDQEKPLVVRITEHIRATKPPLPIAQAKNELVVGVVHWKRDLCADEVIGDKVDILGCSPEYALRRVSQVYTARQPEKRGSVGGKVASGVDFYSPALLNRHYLQKSSVDGSHGPVSFGHDVM